MRPKDKDMEPASNADETELPIEPELAALLETLRATPPRDEKKARQGRAAFLAIAQAMAADQPARPKPGWQNMLRNHGFTPALRPVSAALAIGAALMFGGGAAVFAAQSASPNDPTYPIKVWSEDVRIAFAGNDDRKLTLLVEFAARRTRELELLAARHQEPPPEFVTRFGNQVNQAMSLLHDQDEADADGEPLNPAAREALARAYEKVKLQTQHTPARPDIPIPGSQPDPSEDADEDEAIGNPPTDHPDREGEDPTVAPAETPTPRPVASPTAGTPAATPPEAQATVILPPQVDGPRPPLPQPDARATVILPPQAGGPRPPVETPEQRPELPTREGPPVQPPTPPAPPTQPGQPGQPEPAPDVRPTQIVAPTPPPAPPAPDTPPEPTQQPEPEPEATRQPPVNPPIVPEPTTGAIPTDPPPPLTLPAPPTAPQPPGPP